MQRTSPLSIILSFFKKMFRLYIFIEFMYFSFTNSCDKLYSVSYHAPDAGATKVSKTTVMLVLVDCAVSKSTRECLYLQ